MTSRGTTRPSDSSSSSSSSSDDVDDNSVVFDAVRDEYRDMAPWYDTFWRSYTDATLEVPLDVALEAMAVVTTSSAVNDSDSDGRRPSLVLVDVGCGTGSFLRRLVDRAVLPVRTMTTTTNGVAAVAVGATSSLRMRLIGFDPSMEMLEVARGKFDDDEMAGGSTTTVTFERSPAERLPRADESVDVVCCTNALHFFRDGRRSLLEMRRVLRPGGTLIIVDWCADYALVRLYHLLEGLRWNDFLGGGGGDRYPGPLTSVELRELVESTDDLRVTRHDSYRVRVFSVFFWGMQTIVATKG